MRIGDNFFDDLVAALGIGIDGTHGRGTAVDIFKDPFQIALLFVDKRLPVGEQEFHVPGLRAVDGGVVDFVQDAVGDGVPDAAGGGARHADTIFSAGSPARFYSWRAKRRALPLNPAIAGSLIRHRLAFPPKLQST